MSKNSRIFLILFLINLSMILVSPEENYDENNKIINYCSEQEYNITDPNDNFFNDICSIFYSNTKRDVSLEYRRKYYYYYTNSNESSQILLNKTELEETFPEIKRNNIYSCFKHHFSPKIMVYNISLYIITFIFIIQIISFIFLFIGDYKNASYNNPEKYWNNKKKKSKKINGQINVVTANTESPIIENKTNIFTPLNEEIKKDDTIKNDVENGQSNDQIEFETLDKNRIHDLKDSNELDNNFEKNVKNKSIKIDDIITFAQKGIPMEEINEIEKNENNQKSDKNKENETNYIYGKMNSKPIKKMNSKEKEVKLDQTPDELFYDNYGAATLIQDKRTLMQMYFDILPHCQIIFFFMKKFFIYEDTDVILLYYSIKIELYFIFNVIVLNKNSVINKLFDNEFSFFDGLIKCLFATIIVNIISQILFFFTNSKKKFIKHINKLKNSPLFIYYKKQLNQSLQEIITILNNNLYEKLIILCVLNIFIFLSAFYCSLCFCSTYYYTQFIVLRNIVISMIISQTFPFILVFIPSLLRKKSLETRKYKELLEIKSDKNSIKKGNGKSTKNSNERGKEILYYFSQYINSLFIP